MYSKPRRRFVKWLRFHSYHLDRLDEGWDIAEDHVGQKLTVPQLIKYRRWYGPQIAAQVKDDDPERQKKLAFALEWIPEPLESAPDESPRRPDPNDPHERWPKDISKLEESSCGSPLPGDQSKDAMDHRQRKAERHRRNREKVKTATVLDERKA